MVIRYLISRFFSPPRLDFFLKSSGTAIPWVLAGLVFVFFLPTFAITLIPKGFRFGTVGSLSFFFLPGLLENFLPGFQLTRPQHVLLAMTTTARNSPLMLGLATIVLPNQPMVYAVLILGMLVEFPHLTLLSNLFKRRAQLSSLNNTATT